MFPRFCHDSLSEESNAGDNHEQQEACWMDQKPGPCWKVFVARIGKGLLPNDGFKSGPFDQLLHLYLGDPHAKFGGQGRQSETMDLQGGPDWNKLLLTHCLHIRLYDTVYVLVDMPDLTKVILVFVQAHSATGLQRVYVGGQVCPRCLRFPRINFVLDSDCIPVTLFKVEVVGPHGGADLCRLFALSR